MDFGHLSCVTVLVRAVLVTSGVLVLVDAVLNSFPGWLDVTLEVLLLLLSLYNIYTLRENLGTRAFTILVMAMELVEALLSLLLLVPSPDVNRLILAALVAVISVVDMVIGVYYELRAGALVALVATGSCEHPIYKGLSRNAVKFFVIFGTLLRVVIPFCLADLFAFDDRGGSVGIGLVFFLFGLIQAGVAALGFGTTFFCCLACLRPTTGKIFSFVPVAMVGAFVEVMLLLLVLQDGLSALGYLILGSLWALLLCFPVVRVLETSILFTTFQVDHALATGASAPVEVVLAEEAMPEHRPSIVEATSVVPSAPSTRRTGAFSVPMVIVKGITKDPENLA